ncbi:MAG: hypothetical protein QME55_07160 [Brevundimonas sp.]|uniref:hypothetical protein n=1 Tax=Brevundimonas sp. TaxID=1871086 RepID=UPI002614E5F8|nr:hypothetical protein [Brevundimonas sp.]MDI6624491.1 hypothetical protein [Brevundimonas sp.]MDQ7813920.1 hypothetical protein [Brevundimonas sp.]
MKMISRAAMAALLLGAASCNQPSTAADNRTEAVTFVARPDLAEAVEALPRLVGEGDAIAAINADLDRRDAAAGPDCEGAGGFERGVSQPMTGPDLVSFWIAEGQYCEGAFSPTTSQTAITYDLATGQPVDWVAAAPGLQLTRGDPAGQPADHVPGLSSTALSGWYSAEALASPDREHVEQCADIWTPEALEGVGYKVWLDARNGGLSVSPEFAQVAQGCADTATLNAEEMRRFGVSPPIVDAVVAGHAAGSWAPKDD